MKINLASKVRRQQGVALLITIIIVLVSAAILASYLLVTENELRVVNRSQIWNSSMTLTEAGVEEALAFMNKYEGSLSQVSQWSTATSAAADGWTVSGTTYTMTRTLSTNMGYYTVTIDDTISNAPVITSVGYAYFTMASTQPQSSPFMLASAGVNNSGYSTTVSRSVIVSNVFLALFPDAIDSITNIDLKGNNIRVDSFDSTKTNYSDWTTNGYGTYDAAKARGNGNVATDSDIVGAISVGQANIYGTVNTGPGGSTTVGANGYVGPYPQSGSGIQPGYSNDTMNITFPDVVLPTGAALWTTVSDGGTISASGNYYISGISSGLTISGSNIVVTIYVAGSISGSIAIGQQVSSVTMYVKGPSIALAGNSTINNQTQQACRLGIYGLPSLTSVDLHGNAAFSGTLYAPEAAFTFGGGGNNTQDFVGAVVVNSLSLNGHANMHYDESLKVTGPGRGYIPTSWKEVGVQ
jgi:hypothetical protein